MATYTQGTLFDPGPAIPKRGPASRPVAPRPRASGARQPSLFTEDLKPSAAGLPRPGTMGPKIGPTSRFTPGKPPPPKSTGMGRIFRGHGKKFAAVGVGALAVAALSRGGGGSRGGRGNPGPYRDVGMYGYG